MTDDERVESRAAASQPGGDVRTQSVESRFSEKLDGREHPEQLLPFELFDHLLKGLSTNSLSRDNAHALYEAKIKTLGYDVDAFWK